MLVVVNLHCCSIHAWLQSIIAVRQVGELERHVEALTRLEASRWPGVENEME